MIPDEEEKPPDVSNSPPENTEIKDEAAQKDTFPLKDFFDDTLRRAREIRKKYSPDENVDEQK